MHRQLLKYLSVSQFDSLQCHSIFPMTITMSCRSIVAVVQGMEAISWAAGRSLLSKQVSVEDQGISMHVYVYKYASEFI